MKSSIQIYARDICARQSIKDKKINHTISSLFAGLNEKFRFENCTVFIEQPSDAIVKVFSSAPLVPSAESIERFDNYDNKLMNELIIASWRYLAVMQPKKTEPVTNKIVQNMRAYLEANGIYEGSKGSFAERTFTNIATKIVAQWKSGNNFEPALINSTPTKKADLA